MTVAAIEALIVEGAQIVLITGGMSVDPDDLTPGSIRATGAEIITYGAPCPAGGYDHAGLLERSAYYRTAFTL